MNVEFDRQQSSSTLDKVMSWNNREEEGSPFPCKLTPKTGSTDHAT